MPKGKRSGQKPFSTSMIPAKTPEDRENQLISLAVELAEQKLRDGTASSQVIVHYLKLGSTKEKLEKEILGLQKELIKAKTENLQATKQVSQDVYADAVNSLRNYSGMDNDEY